MFVETSYDAPEQWEIWSRFAVGVGAHTPGAFDADLETRSAEGMDTPTRADLDAWANGWTRYVVLTSSGAPSPERLDVNIVGYTLVHEMM